VDQARLNLDVELLHLAGLARYRMTLERSIVLQSYSILVAVVT
jgi:hypothetical protein